LFDFCAVFSVLAITPSWNLQMMFGWMSWKANLISIHTMYSMYHEILYNGTVLHGKLIIMQADELLTSLH
jgi:hypothetical protein